jgi:hypothetical protein
MSMGFFFTFVLWASILEDVGRQIMVVSPNERREK